MDGESTEPFLVAIVVPVESAVRKLFLQQQQQGTSGVDSTANEGGDNAQQLTALEAGTTASVAAPHDIGELYKNEKVGLFIFRGTKRFLSKNAFKNLLLNYLRLNILSVRTLLKS